MKLLKLVVAALLLAGCASLLLTPEEKHAAMEAQRFADRIAEAYKVPKVRVIAGGLPAGVGGQMRGNGVLLVDRYGATSAWFRRVIVAHEMAHWINGDWAKLTKVWTGTGGNLSTTLEYSKVFELEANAKGVEILQRVEGFSEHEAVEYMYQYIQKVREAHFAGMDVSPAHSSPCQQIASLRQRFPAQADWAKPCE